MQYLVNVIHDSSGLAPAEEMAAIDVFNAQLRADDHWVFAGGLAGPDAATTLDNRADAGIMIDGPFVETKEFVVGFWIIDAPDLDVALRLARGASKACNRKVEIRPIL